ncbi:MAG: hypothetical protein A2X94_15200 [Bdellovibrionales bacterium GWB1_55_8]|nr:MAG: hypothetical protein A2X94_15200 [Bdellovibrionales bacterium GWB1_55_8]
MSSIPNLDPRYFVPDLSPQQRGEVRNFFVDRVFVAESPHIHEVEPEDRNERRPLCGAAGRRWWRMLGELLEQAPLQDLCSKSLVDFCAKHRFAVLNAIQFPLDPAVTRLFPQADPLKTLGFSKAAGVRRYKRMKDSEEVRGRLTELRARLEHPALAGKPIYALGKDAEWFLLQALGDLKQPASVGWIPHPSAWWRQGGKLENDAREKLKQVFDC